MDKYLLFSDLTNSPRDCGIATAAQELGELVFVSIDQWPVALLHQSIKR